MSTTQDTLQQIRIASPCSADWEAMDGDDRVRFCRACRKNVYNLSALPADEAAALVREREGELCVRFYRRADGTMLTADCPRGLAAVRLRMRRVWAGVFALAASLLAAVGSAWNLSRSPATRESGSLQQLRTSLTTAPPTALTPPGKMNTLSVHLGGCPAPPKP